MAEKVKVSREVAEYIEGLRTKFDLDDCELIAFLSTAITHKDKYGKDETLQMIKAVINGYETEPTPEEKIVATFLKIKRKCEESDEPHEVEWERGFNSGIQYTLGILEIKIQGINK